MMVTGEAGEKRHIVVEVLSIPTDHKLTGLRECRF